MLRFFMIFRSPFPFRPLCEEKSVLFPNENLMIKANIFGTISINKKTENPGKENFYVRKS